MNVNDSVESDVIPLVQGPQCSVGCGECPFAKNGKPIRPVPGIGPADPQWVVVGEGPGQVEHQSRRPFMGPSGQVVNRALATIGIDRRTLWVTNVTLCKPPRGASPDLKKAAAAACRPRLAAELATMAPFKPVLALGGVAAQTFLGSRFTITKLAGTSHRVSDMDVIAPADPDVISMGTEPEPGRWVIPSPHPAMILRGGKGGGGAHTVEMLYWSLLYDVNKVNYISRAEPRGERVEFSDDIDIEVSDPDRANKMLLAFVEHVYEDPAGQRLFAFDVETVGRDGHPANQPYFAQITAIGLATVHRGISVRWDLLTGSTRARLQSLFADRRVTNAAHNRGFDRPVMRYHGIPVLGATQCTLLLHHNAFPGMPHDLQRTTGQFFVVRPWKAEFRGGRGEAEELAVYNARDALSTARLVRPLTVCVKKADAEKTFAMDMQMAAIAERMHHVGIPLCFETNARMNDQFTTVVDAAYQEILDIVEEPTFKDKWLDRLAFEQAKKQRKKDPPDFELRIGVRKAELEKKPPKFNLDSTNQVVAMLRAKGVPLYRKTKKGATSTDKDTLKTLLHVPEVRLLIAYREAAKMLSTFVRNMPGFCDPQGRFHPSWSVNKITGRWGADGPQVQNWPKDDPKKNRPNLRAQVRPKKGRKLVGADFGQLEARIVAMLSGDPWLCQIFWDGKDVHSEFARLVFKGFDSLPAKERKIMRDMVKRPEYGALYGAAAQTMWESVVVDFPEVKLVDIIGMRKLMFNQMTGVQNWHNELIRFASERRELRSAIYGRRRCFPLGQIDPSDAYNFPVQSTGADIMDTGLLRLLKHPRYPSTADVIIQVHDAVVVECDEDDAEVVAECITEALTQDHQHNGIHMHFPADAAIADSWAGVG